MASLPSVFKAPESKGSAIHPLLLAFFYSLPSLVKTVSGSSTDEKTLSCAVKKAWGSLAQGNNASAKPVWDLIGEATLIPADSAELLTQMCDLFDAELHNAAAKALGFSTKIVIHAGARVKDGKPSEGYTLALSIPIQADIQGHSLTSLLQSNFATEKIDYMFPDDVEPISSDKKLSIAGGFHECVVVHLQRYRYDFEFMRNAKIYDRIEFPEQMSGKEFASYADEDSTKAISGSTLDLVAVLTHHDEKGYGLLLRPDAKGPWFKCCDIDYQEVPTETSIESAFGGELDSDVAYMLFYKVSGGGQGALAGLTKKLSRKSLTNKTADNPAATTTKSTPSASPAAASSSPSAQKPALKTGAAAENKSGGGCCVVQ